MSSNLSPTALIREQVQHHDKLHIQVIMQYLSSRGLSDTLASLESESEIFFNPNFLPSGSVLDHLLEEYNHTEQSVGSVANMHIAPPTLIEPRVAVTDIIDSIPNVHGQSANPTCVAWAGEILATGGADSRVILRERSDLTKELKVIQMPSPVLCIDCSTTNNDMVVGCMGGEVVFYRINDTELEDDSHYPLTTFRPHGVKRIMSAVFNNTGTLCATIASNDHTLKIFKRANSGEWMNIEAAASCPNNYSFILNNNLAAISWLQGNLLAVAEDSNCIISVVHVDISGNLSAKVIRHICMNKYLDDPRTSAYTARSMYFDETSQTLAACTSRNSVLLFRIESETPENTVSTPNKTLYGMSIGPYDTPCVSMSVDAKTVYVTNNNEILLIDINTGHKLYGIRVSETKPIRHLRRHPIEDLIATVAFDKQLTIIE